MTYLSVRDLAKDYRYKVPPFSIKRDVYGPEYTNTREVASFREWLSFKWFRYRLNKRMTLDLERWLQAEQVNTDAFQRLQISLEQQIAQIENKFSTLTESEKEEIRKKAITSPGLLNLGIPPTPTNLNESLFADSSVAIIPGIEFPIPVPKPKFPLPIPGIDPPDAIKAIDPSKVIKLIEEKLTGLVGGALETVKQLIEGIVGEVARIIFNFLNRLVNIGELFLDGLIDQAIAGIFEAIVLFVADVILAIGAIVLNFVNNVISGVIGGLLFGRPLAKFERDFAHEIFGNQINVTLIRIVKNLLDAGMVAANVIYMPSSDLSNPKYSGLFAHELTHVWQDQNPFGNSTHIATREKLGHYYSTHGNPYVVRLTATTHWDSLGAEEQATVVGRYQNCLDGLDYQHIKHGRDIGVDRDELPHFERVLSQAGFFQWK